MDGQLTDTALIHPERQYPVQIPRVSFWQRFFAMLIDLVIIGILAGFLNIIGVQNWFSGASPEWISIAAGIVLGAIPLIYFIAFYSTSGQTPGKRALKIKVISVDGSPLNLGKGIIRGLGYICSGAVFYLGFLWSIWDVEKRTWHDKMAGTSVVASSFQAEQLQGMIAPPEIKRQQKKWLIRIGIPVVILILVGTLAIYAVINMRLDEVRSLGPWPVPEVSPQAAASPDLSSLGLSLDKIQDARNQGNWAGANYDVGVVVSYKAGSQVVALISALRYKDKQTAGGDYQTIQAYSGQTGVCGRYAYAYNQSSGLVHCQFSNLYEKVFWNQDWIIDIVAMEGAQSTPDILVDQIRDSMAAHWQTLSTP